MREEKVPAFLNCHGCVCSSNVTRSMRTLLEFWKSLFKIKTRPKLPRWACWCHCTCCARSYSMIWLAFPMPGLAAVMISLQSWKASGNPRVSCHSLWDVFHLKSTPECTGLQTEHIGTPQENKSFGDFSYFFIFLWTWLKRLKIQNLLWGYKRCKNWSCL